MTVTQLGFAGMPTRLFACTPSRLTTWLDCPRRYRFVYVDRPTPAKGAPWAHNSVGAAVHSALAAWWDLPVDQRTAARGAALAREKWIDLGFRDDQQSADWRERAAAMVGSYLDRIDPRAEPVGVERTVAMRTDRLAVSGRIDRLDLRGDELVVVDYKTGRHVLTTDDARGSLALAIYALAAARTLRRQCVRVELHHLPTGEVVEWTHTAESLDRHLRRAEDIGAEAAAAQASARAGSAGGPTGGEPEVGSAPAGGAATAAHAADADRLDALFPPRPGPMCGWCDFSAHCTEGRAARAPYVSWAGLAPEVSPTVDDG
ncbi:MAG TPA: PD-(D/E)XK nuclease family protein [Mycobacteriales bacterium]|nr:PD-(D/E)XK nuclease family protein [Mycobacteriales bacterium]